MIKEFNKFVRRFWEPLGNQRPKYTWATALMLFQCQWLRSCFNLFKPSDCKSTCWLFLIVFNWWAHSHPCWLAFWGNLLTGCQQKFFWCWPCFDLCYCSCRVAWMRVGPFTHWAAFWWGTQIQRHRFEAGDGCRLWQLNFKNGSKFRKLILWWIRFCLWPDHHKDT